MKSITYYSSYVKSMFTASYSIDYNFINCYACDNVCIMYMHINLYVVHTTLCHTVNLSHNLSYVLCNRI